MKDAKELVIDICYAVDGMVEVPGAGIELGTAVIERDREEVRAEERRACAERFCAGCLADNYDRDGLPAPCNHLENGRHCKWYAVILAAEPGIAKEWI